MLVVVIAMTAFTRRVYNRCGIIYAFRFTAGEKIKCFLGIQNRL